jgi:branched-chain amino acid transport system permease protein
MMRGAERRLDLGGLARRLRPARAASPLGPVPVVLVAALLAVYPLVLTAQFWRNTGILALVFAIAAMGWNVLGGYTGQISWGNAVFFGTGAYATALLVKAGWSPWPTMLVGAAAAAVVGLAIGFPCFRLRSHYFAIATIAVGEIADVVVTANSSVGGSSGIDIPTRANSLANLQFPPTDTAAYYYVALGLTVLAGIAMWLFGRGRSGAYAQAIRDNEEAAQAVGIPARRYKLLAVAVSGAITAVAGSFYAMYDLFVDPSLVFDLSVSISIALMVIFGGSGSFWGPLLGAWALTILQQFTLQQFGSSVSGLDLLIFGFLIVLVVIVEPGGLMALGRRAIGSTRRLSSFRPIRHGRGLG